MNITIEKPSRSNMADFFDFFDNRAFSDGSPLAPCYCNAFYLTAEEVRDGIGKSIMQGYLAYVDGIAIGWCNANDRQNYVRAGSFIPDKKLDEDYYISNGEYGKIKSLVCFEIAPEYRGKGIAKALMHRVCDDAENDGYEFVEVYPQITENFSSFDFTGPMEMYGNFGFKEIDRHGNTVIMRKKVS